MRTADDLYQNRINVWIVMMQTEIFGKMRVIWPQRRLRFLRMGVVMWEFCLHLMRGLS